VGALVTVLGVVVWHPVPIGVWHDDGAYLLIAQALAEGRGLTWSGVPGELPAAKFPPVYPGILALLLSSGVDPSGAARPVALLSTALLAMSAGLFAVIARRTLQVGALGAGALALLVWLSPAFWRLAAVPHSEPLFLAAIALALLIVTPPGARSDPPPSSARLEDPVPRATPWASLAAFVAAYAVAVHTRSAGVALLPAFVLALAMGRQFWRSLSVAVVGGLVLVPWSLWSGAATERIPEPLRDVLGGYGSWWTSQLAEAPGQLFGLAGKGLQAVAVDVAAILVPGRVPAGLVLAALVPALVLGLVRLGQRAPTVAWFVVFYAGVVALWPFRAQRLLVPLLPWLALAAAAALDPRRLRGSVKAKWAVSALGVLLLGTYAVSGAQTMVRGQHAQAFETRAQALAAAVEAVHRFTPEDAVVGAPELWPGIAIHTGRSVSPSARFLPLAREGPSWGTPHQQAELWSRAGITHVVVEHGGGVHGATLDELDARCAPGTVQLLATIPTGFLVGVTLSTECLTQLAADRP